MRDYKNNYPDLYKELSDGVQGKYDLIILNC